jgi:type I restriction enzyme S subunit
MSSYARPPAAHEAPLSAYAAIRSTGLADLKPYPAMKDSGIAWLGNVPKHWSVVPSRAIFAEVRERNHPQEQMLSVTIRRGVVRQKALLAQTSKKDSSNEDKSAYKLVRPGDIAYNKMRAWQGAVGLSSYHGIVSPAYVVQRPRPGFDARYLHYLLRTPAFAKEAERWSYGITSDMWSLRPEHFKMICASVPPFDEQRAIVRYLDHADRRISRYIGVKQKLIKLLEEQKQATIYRAVTRGLDPKVAFKPSGLAWLGDIPAHWNQLPLSRCLLRIDQGWSPIAAEGDISPNQWVVLTLSAVKQGMFRPDAVKPIPPSAAIPAGIEIQDGDLLLTRSNTRELVGDVCIVENVRARTLLCDLIYRLKLDSIVLQPRFLMLQLLSPLGRIQIERDARGSSATMPKISQRHIRSWRVIAPPLSEQSAIVESIHDLVAKINGAVARANVEISLLRECRTRLIVDVVTGKLDVRETASGLPEKMDELEEVGPGTDLEDGALEEGDRVTEVEE